MSKKPVVLMVLDGYGLSDHKEGNAIAMANTPVMDKLMAECPFVKGAASGLAVGLPDGQMGNSEVGHTNIGAGRIVYQELTRITKSIEDGDFFSIPELVTAIENCKKHNSKLHILGLLSDGGVHSHIRHLYGLLEMAKRRDFENVYVHCFLDGRDTPPASAEGYITQLEEKMKEIGVGKIATLSGRYYAMDRDKRWNRIEKAYDAMIKGEGEKAISAAVAIENSYQKEVFDEFVVPTVICNNDKPVAKIEENDSVIFFNFRPDRAREITFALTDPNFEGFKTEKMDKLLVTPMQEYSDELKHLNTMYPPKIVTDNLACLISEAGKTQYHISETTKYAHVTFFFNGGIEEPYKGETRKLIDSYNDKNFAVHPQMRAPEITESLMEAIDSKKYDFILVNFSNPDMIGHTGDFEAAKQAVKICDECAYKVAMETVKMGGECIIIADHGNVEEMFDEQGTILTKHTTNKVPFILVSDKNKNVKLKQDGSLANVAPTIVKMMGLQIPTCWEKPMIK